MALAWLHVSDFHLSDKGPYDQEVILRSLVSSVKQFREEGHVPDLIFATGDIAQSGKATEYERATNFFDDLLDAAGLDRERLFLVPGNHDVDRNAGEFLARTISSADSADRFFSPDKPLPHLSLKFQAFAAWYNDYFKAIRSFPANTTCSPVELVSIRESRVAILPLNSALFCIDDHDHQQLFIGRRSLDAAKKQLAAADLTIALIHHPLDWLSSVEQVNIETSLEESVDLLLQGHFHQAAVKGVVSANGGYLKLAAGASYQTRQYPNSAMYATFNDNQVTIYPISYKDTPREVWTLDTSIFPSPSFIGSFKLLGRTTISGSAPIAANQQQESLPPVKSHAEEAERYQSILKGELGFIRMLGLPGVESVKVNLNDDTFVPLRFSRSGDPDRSSGKNCVLQEAGEQILTPDRVMREAFRVRRMLLVIGDRARAKQRCSSIMPCARLKTITMRGSVFQGRSLFFICRFENCDPRKTVATNRCQQALQTGVRGTKTGLTQKCLTSGCMEEDRLYCLTVLMKSATGKSESGCASGSMLHGVASAKPFLW